MKKLYCLVLLILLFGCSSHVLVVADKDFKSYKTAHVELLQNDEFNLGSFITAELADMGFKLVKKAEAEMLVRYSYQTSWDFTTYLQKYQVIFLDAKAETIIANLDYHLTGNWVGTRTRQVQGFNELRSKLGYPPSKM